MVCGTTEGTLHARQLSISKQSPHTLRRFHWLHCAEHEGSHLCRGLCGPPAPPQWYLPHRTVGASTIEQPLPLAQTNCPKFTLSPHFGWTHGCIVDTHTSRCAFKLQTPDCIDHFNTQTTYTATVQICRTRCDNRLMCGRHVHQSGTTAAQHQDKDIHQRCPALRLLYLGLIACTVSLHLLPFEPRSVSI